MIDIKQKARELLVQAVGISIDYATDVDSDDALSAIEAALQQRVPTKWLPIETAPKDNERPLWIAQFNQDTGKLIALDWDASWEREQESWEIPQVYYIWRSANGSVEEPTHWAYQESDTPPLSVMQQPAAITVRDAVHGTVEVTKVFPGDVIAAPYDTAPPSAPAPVAGDAVAALVEQWRKEAYPVTGTKAARLAECADELEVALAQDRASQGAAPSTPVGVDDEDIARVFMSLRIPNKIAAGELITPEDWFDFGRGCAALARQPAACPRCKGTGEADSGGIMPWGAPATIPCDCPQPAAVPGGWVLVPKVATEWMIDAGVKALSDSGVDDANINDALSCYEAMTREAPSPGGQS